MDGTASNESDCGARAGLTEGAGGASLFCNNPREIWLLRVLCRNLVCFKRILF